LIVHNLILQQKDLRSFQNFEVLTYDTQRMQRVVDFGEAEEDVKMAKSGINIDR